MDHFITDLPTTVTLTVVIDSGNVSRAQCIDRKTSVTPIYIDSNIQNAVTAVTS